MPGRRDHEGHADGEHADDARLRQHVPDVVPGRERVRLQDRADDEQQRRRRSRARTPGTRAPSPGRAPIPARAGSVTSYDLLDETGASVGATAWRSSARSVASLPSTSATISPSRMTRTRVQMPTSSSSSDETTSTPRPDAGELADDPVDLRLRRDVDAARRLVEEEHAALVEQPAREHDLLLVAAGEQPDGAVGIVRDGVQRPQLLARGLALPPDVEQHAREAAAGRRPSRSSSGSSRGRAPATSGPPGASPSPRRIAQRGLAGPQPLPSTSTSPSSSSSRP